MNNEQSIKNASASSKSQMSNVNKIISYAFLGFVAIVMILPLLWLINGSFQPAWQINADPVIWIPREWMTVKAGDSGRELCCCGKRTMRPARKRR